MQTYILLICVKAKFKISTGPVQFLKLPD